MRRATLFERLTRRLGTCAPFLRFDIAATVVAPCADTRFINRFRAPIAPKFVFKLLWKQSTKEKKINFMFHGPQIDEFQVKNLILKNSFLFAFFF